MEAYKILLNWLIKPQGPIQINIIQLLLMSYFCEWIVEFCDMGLTFHWLNLNIWIDYLINLSYPIIT